MLVGLSRLHGHRCDTFGLGRFLWKQVSFWRLQCIQFTLMSRLFVRKGVIWLFFATVAEITPGVSQIKVSCTPYQSFTVINIVGIHQLRSQW
jgi:hypothetical protein